MKKILLLGGSAQQIVAIKTAQKLGYYTVLCDYLPDNPGQYEADKFYLVSTTDKEAVLKVALDECVDGVLAYASDPAAPTAAYVAEKMKLLTNPYESVMTLCNKDRFRSFLKNNGFNTPVARGYSNNEVDTTLFSLPVIIKPVDSSGSNAQAYFQEPIDGFETLYTCRKFFGVPDGAVLYTDKQIEINEVDQSYTRMHFLLGRYEKTAGEFYQEYVDNNHLFKDEPIKRMSRLTENLLHGLDYELVKTRRTENFAYLHEQFKAVNQLKLICPSGAFMYPLYLPNGAEIRKKLQAHKIFIPTLWPAVFNICDEGELEYNMAKNILPIPVDQRYTIDDMNYIVNILETMR